ncbi:MAG TPA: YlzJ-like family protein [Bacillota bacterium]|nr:YlzJ-like family protein [Peptococcaceae bacterium MAG4]NLW39161.1 hypothetical protein [Peptococcaceae bacterium]HPU36114.1 YlzJ-like family protein [Bacillota bacterium]HPZ44386.1 YlzJ-like family protein [Bacillota bacterium]HQD75117.1 YlzJ-like family protein [Bacillota bacterium]
MILYTPMQLELVLEGFDPTKYPEYREVDYNGVPMLVEDAGFGTTKIVKLLSTRPADYLRPELLPGNLVKY